MDETLVAAQWWKTAIVDIEPNKINIRGYPIQELIGSVSFVSIIWLMLRGDLPSADQATLLEAALVAGVDHGPQAPSIAIARMSATCGIGLNNAVASGINALGDIHGGAGQECLEIYDAIVARLSAGAALEEALEAEVGSRLAAKQHIPGFGHRFHQVDPRSGPLLSLINDAAARGSVAGTHATIARGVEDYLRRRKGKTLPLNIDGVTAAIYGELGFPAPLSRGLFVLSRSVGILSHAWEQSCEGARIKGPMPPSIPYTYFGNSERHYP
jgi:citrate synthase